VLPGGLMLRGLSGGERKRLSVGAALIPQPQLIFADEPTSGKGSGHVCILFQFLEQHNTPV